MKIAPILLLLIAFFISIPHNTIAQKDTLYQYLNEDENICDKQKAFYVLKTFQYGNGRWKSIEFEMSSMDSIKENRSPDSLFANSIDTSIIYGKVLNEYFSKKTVGQLKKEFITKDGRNKGYAIFDSKNKIIEQKGWDDNGNEISDYTYFKEATYKGGAKGWLQYVTNNLRMDVPAQNGAPTGSYKVYLSFLVNKTGIVSDVRADYDPGYGTAKEAIRLLLASGKWNPAILNNQPVTYLQKQSLTFIVN